MSDTPTTLDEIEARAKQLYKFTRQVAGEVHVSLDGSNWSVYYGQHRYSIMTPQPDPESTTAELSANVWNHMYVVWSADEMTSGEFEYRYRQVMKLLASELQSLCTAAKPEKHEVDWQDISTPELVAKQSEAYGYNEAIDDMEQRLTKAIEQMRGTE